MEEIRKELRDIDKVVANHSDRITVAEARLNRHGERLDDFERFQISLPQIMQESVTRALQPVLATIEKLNEENQKLRYELIEVKNEKFKSSDRLLKWALGIIGSSILAFIVGSIITSVVNK